MIRDDFKNLAEAQVYNGFARGISIFMESLNEELASNKLSEEEKDSALETIQDLEYQNVTNKLILGILDDNRLKEAKKNAKNKDVFK